MQFSVIVGGIVEASLVQQLAFAHGYLWRSSSDKVQRLGDFSRYINFDFNIKRFYQCSSYDNAFKPTVTLNELGDYLSGAKKIYPTLTMW